MRYEDTRQAAGRERLVQVLGGLAEQTPDAIKSVELWRPTVVNHSGYADDQTEVWVRLGEDVQAFKREKPAHYKRVETGTEWQEKGTELFLVADYSLKPDDHVVIDGEAFIVFEEQTGYGFQKLTITRDGQRFVRPARTEPVYRQMAMKARIV